MAFPCLRWAHLPCRTLFCTQQTSLDSFVSHPSLGKHRQEMNVVLQWFTPYWKHLLSKKSIQSSFGFTCLLFSLCFGRYVSFIRLFPTSEMHLTMFDFCPLTWIVVWGFFTSTVFNCVFSENDTKLKPLILSLPICLSFCLFLVFNFCFFSFFLLHPPPLSLQNPTFLHVSLLLCYLY